MQNRKENTFPQLRLCPSSVAPAFLMGTELRCKARLRGHSSWVTCLYTLVNSADDCLQVLSGSTGTKSLQSVAFTSKIKV